MAICIAALVFAGSIVAFASGEIGHSAKKKAKVGPRGPAGPAGPAGAQGPQGPAGPGAKSLRLTASSCSGGFFTPSANCQIAYPSVQGVTLTATCYQNLGGDTEVGLDATTAPAGSTETTTWTNRLGGGTVPAPVSGVESSSGPTLLLESTTTQKQGVGTAIISFPAGTVSVAFDYNILDATQRCDVHGTVTPAA